MVHFHGSDGANFVGHGPANMLERLVEELSLRGVTKLVIATLHGLEIGLPVAGLFEVLLRVGESLRLALLDWTTSFLHLLPLVLSGLVSCLIISFEVLHLVLRF